MIDETMKLIHEMDQDEAVIHEWIDNSVRECREALAEFVHRCNYRAVSELDGPELEKCLKITAIYIMKYLNGGREEL